MHSPNGDDGIPEEILAALQMENEDEWLENYKPSPTPWKMDGRIVVDANIEMVIEFIPTVNRPTLADTAHIVRCVNAHDDLVDACQRAEEIVNAYAAGPTAINPPDYRAAIGTIDRLRAALAKAKGE